MLPVLLYLCWRTAVYPAGTVIITVVLVLFIREHAVNNMYSIEI